MIIDADAILFDSDGVLVDSHKMVAAAWTEIATTYSLDIDVLLAELAGVRAYDTLSKYLSGGDLDDAIAHLERLEIETAGRTVALPGAIDLVGELPPATFAFVTSASRALAEARWGGAGVSLPPARVTADDVIKGKPDPEPFLVGARLLGIDPERCVVFEDSPSGGEAGKAAGAVVVAVGATPWPFEPVARVADLSAVSVVSTSPSLQLLLG